MDKNQYTLQAINKAFSGISLFCEILVIISYYIYRPHKTIRFEIIIYLTISCLIYNLAAFFPYSEVKENNPFWCGAQAFCIITFQISAVIWSLYISYITYISKLNKNYIQNRSKEYRLMFSLFALLFPMVISTVYLSY